MLISEKEIRKTIRKYLLKEISDEKWKGPAGEEYRKIYNKKEDTRGEGEYFKDKEKGFKYNIQTGLKPTYLNDLKRWWFKNADHDFFNNVEDLKGRKEEVVVIHSLTAYEYERGLDKDLLKYCEKIEKNYKNPNSINRNELSAIGYINSEKKDAYEICKQKIGTASNAGSLNVFLYLNTRKITAAGGGSGDLGTETFNSYAEKDEKSQLLKKKEFLEKIKKYKYSLEKKMTPEERYEELDITAQETHTLSRFINKNFGFYDMSNSVKDGNSTLNIKGIFEENKNPYEEEGGARKLIEYYKSILDFEINPISCSNNFKKEVLKLEENHKIYIKPGSTIILFDLIFFNTSQEIHASLGSLLTSEDESINQNFLEKDIKLNNGLAKIIVFHNKELFEIYRNIWLSCLKKFFEKNIKELKNKNVEEKDLILALKDEKEKFKERYEQPWKAFYFENSKKTINKKEVMEYLNNFKEGGVKKSYKDATKQSGTRKYPAIWQYDLGNALSKENKSDQVSNSNILDREEIKGDYIDEVIVGNWKIDSVWFNMNFSELFQNFKKEKQKEKDITFKDYLEKNHDDLKIKNLYFFALKGFKCFDVKGNILQKELYLRIKNDL
jgi:hypothetical protein